MPELPEVETTISYLKKKVLGREVINTWVDNPNMIKRISVGAFKKGVKNRLIKDIFRLGKNIIFELDKNRAILIHQKMTGHFLVGRWHVVKGRYMPMEMKSPLADPMNLFIHLIFFLDNGEMISLSDLRKFAKVILGSKEEIMALPEIVTLGPDALKIEFKDFKDRLLKNSRKKIKQVLMDQKVISGIGNIYSDEILFASKINPFTITGVLAEKHFKLMFAKMKTILKQSIKLEGESISDYRTPEGKKGNYDKIRKVYRRKGQKCFNCEGTVERKKIGGRSTHFCPKCQPIIK
jgi:formamidopyrimidine-DNA glycosylase